MNLDNFRFHEEHLWCVKTGDDEWTIGISDFAQHSLGEIVYFELPEVGGRVSAGDAMGTVESVKVVNDLISPVHGRVLEVNTALEDSPTIGNDDPYAEGWLVKVAEVDEGEFAALPDYASYCESTGAGA